MKIRLLSLLFFFIAITCIAQVPVINSFSPAKALVGATVTITGSNFNTTPTNNIVFFGATKGVVSSATATSLNVVVPVGATCQPITVTNTANGLSAWSPQLFVPTYPSASVSKATFENEFYIAKGFAPTYVNAGDIDGDGKPDVVFINSATNTVSVLKNSSIPGGIDPSSFVGKADFATGSNPSAVKLFDLDGDGKLDIIVNNLNDNTISVLHNKSVSGTINDSSFDPKVDFATGTNPVSFSISDADGDGKPDILVANQGSNNVSFFKNTTTAGAITTGSFVKTDIPTVTSPVYICMGDLDGDKKPDMVAISSANSPGYSVSVYRNIAGSGSGSSLFAPKVDFALPNLPHCLAVADLDGDGKSELIVTGEYQNAYIFKNTATPGTIDAGSLAKPLSFYTSSYSSGEIALGDLNGDGAPDLAISAISNSYGGQQLINNSTANAISFTSTYLSRYASSMSIVDLDGDAIPDVLINSPTTSQISVLRGSPVNASPTITGFTPISGVAGSTVTITGTNFSNDVNNNAVFFGATKAKVTAATATQLQVVVPTGTTYQPLSVTNKLTALTALSQMPFTTTFKGKGGITSNDFNPRMDLIQPDLLGLTLTDVDGDGKPDLVVIDQNSTLSIYPNISSSGTLTKASFGTRIDIATVVSGYSLISITSSDMNGDGKPDLLLSYSGSKEYILLNTSTLGNIAFGSTSSFYFGGGGSYVMQTADLNLDGKMDLGLQAPNSESLLVNLNLKFSYTSNSYNILTLNNNNNSAAFYLADVDGDGRADMIVSNASTGTVSVFQNIANTNTLGFGFGPEVTFTVGSSPGAVKVADIDGDGKPDIIVTNSLGTTVTVLSNTTVKGTISNSSFGAKISYTIGGQANLLAINDLDGDGKPDIITSNANNTISVLRNTSTSGVIDASSFAAHTEIPVGFAINGLALGDIDGDSKPDIVVTSSANHSVSIFRNEPASPSLLLTTTTGKSPFTFSSDTPPVPVVIDGGITVADATNPMPLSSIVKVENYVAGDDVLALTPNAATMGSITAAYSPLTGILSLSASAGATLTQWQAALRAVTYSNSNNSNPSQTDRLVSFSLFSNGLNSPSVNKTVSVTFTNSADATLTGLVLNTGTLTPAFNTDSLSYKVLVGANANVTLNAKTTVTTAAITVNGVAVTSSAVTPLTLNTGDNKVIVTVTSADGAHQKSYTLTVTRAASLQAISFPPIAPVKYGTYYTQLNAVSSNSAIGITYTSSNPAVGTISNTSVQIKSAGTTVITAFQTGSAPVSQTLTVNPADLMVIANNTSIAYGQPIKGLTISYQGFVNSDNLYMITNSPTLSTTATSSSLVGSYPISVTGGSLANYNFVYKPGVLKITGPTVTPFTTPNYFALDASGNRNLVLADLATISKSNGLTPGVKLTPSNLNCSTLGNQTITLSSTDGNPITSGVTFNNPSAVVTDRSGNIYVADAGNNVIRKITPAGLVTTFAGNGYLGKTDGLLLDASFSSPSVLAIDLDGNIYVGENGNKLIRKIDTKGNVTTLGSIGGEWINHMVVDSQHNVFFTGSTYKALYEMSSTGVVSLYAGSTPLSYYYTGVSTLPNITFNNPAALLVNANDDVVVVDQGQIVTIYRSGLFSTATNLSNVLTAAINAQGQLVEVTNSYYGTVVQRANTTYPYFTPIAGNESNGLNDGVGNEASFGYSVPSMAIDNQGNYILVDAVNNSIRKVTPAGVVTTVAGNGDSGLTNGDVSIGNDGRVFSLKIPVYVKSKPTITTSFPNVTITADAAGNAVMPDYVSGTKVTDNCSASGITVTQTVPAGTSLPLNKAVTVTVIATDATGGVDGKTFNVTSIGLGSVTIKPLASPVIIKLDAATASHTITLADVATVTSQGGTPKITFSPAIVNCSTLGNQTITVNASTGAATNPSSMGFGNPQSIALDKAGNIYIADYGLSTIRKISTSGDLTTIAGKPRIAGFADGPGSTALFNNPTGITVDALGNIYVADAKNYRIRKINPAGVVSTVVGNSISGTSTMGYGTLASLGFPSKIIADANNNLYINGYNTSVCKITPEGVLTPVPETSNLPSYYSGGGAMTFDKQGNLYIADYSNSVIKKLTPSGVLTVFSGGGNISRGRVDGPASVATFNRPVDLVFDSKGNLYVCDQADNGSLGWIRKVDVNGNVSTLIDFYTLNYYYVTPSAIAIDASDNMYMTDSFYSQVLKITPDGKFTSMVGDFGNDPGDGNINQLNPSNQTSVQIPVRVLSTPTITSKYTNVTITANASGIAAMPDYTSTATATDNCSNSKITFSQFPAAGTPVNVGTPASIKLTAINTEGAKDSVSFVVTAQYFAFKPLPTLTYGAADFDPGASTSLGGVVYTSSNPAVATIVSGKVHITGAGSVTISANLSGNSTPLATETLTISPAVLTVKADNQSRYYGVANPSLTIAISGFVYNENSSAITTLPTATTTATVSSLSGGYPIVPQGGVAANYSFVYVQGTLTINDLPSITDISPATAINGTTVTITGVNLSGATAVSFGGVAALSFTVRSPTTITAVVGSGNSGNVTVATPVNTATFAGFNFVPVPVITAGGPTTFNSSGSVNLAASPGSGYDYQWLKNGVNIAGATSATYNAIQSGSYTVSISLNGVSQVSAPISATVVFSVPANNFILNISSATCKGAANGFVNITTTQSQAYTATITGNGLNTSYAFTTATAINNLAAGTYNICFTIAGQSTYQQCFTVVITEPKDLSVYTVINNNDKTVTLSLSGGAVYNIQLNGAVTTTTDSQVILPLASGNNKLIVTTDKICQGVIEKDITVADKVMPYPDPFVNWLNISMGYEKHVNVTVQIYTLDGHLVYQKQFLNPANTLSFDLTGLKNTGLYSLKLTTDGSVRLFKILKK